MNEYTQVIPAGDEFAPNGKEITYSWEEFISRSVWEYYPVRCVDTVRLRNIHVPPEENVFATEFFQKLNLPIPELSLPHPNSWRIRFSQYETSGKTIRKKSPGIWFFDETYATHRDYALIDYEHLAIIDLLSTLHLCDPMDIFLKDAAYFEAIAQRNSAVDDTQKSLLAFAPFMGFNRKQTPSFESSIKLNPVLFSSYEDLIERTQLLLDQFDTSDASVEIELIQEPPKRYAR